MALSQTQSGGQTDISPTDRVLVEIGSSAQPQGLGGAVVDELLKGAKLALSERLPLVVALSSDGTSVDEGLPAIDGLGRIAKTLVAASGIIPMVVIVSGRAVAGPTLLLGLVDHVVMCEDALAFVNGPTAVRKTTGLQVSPDSLGGARSHDRSSGLASLIVPDLEAGLEAVDSLLSFFPKSCDEIPQRWSTSDPPDRPTRDAGELLPDLANGIYDVRDVTRVLVDDGELLELHSGWAPNLVTGLATVDGWVVGVIANQPLSLAGTLDIPASQKGARFVQFCDAFNIPLLTLVDTPGFYPGKTLEWRGMIRHGAQLAFAYARATVPRLCLTLRKSYGGAYIVMDSKYMGNDFSLAWPSAEIAVMGAKGAVEILHRRSSEEERQKLSEEYEERLLNPYVAASRGSIDAVVTPTETRAVLSDALGVLQTKRETLQARPHDNMPL